MLTIRSLSALILCNGVFANFAVTILGSQVPSPVLGASESRQSSLVGEPGPAASDGTSSTRTARRERVLLITATECPKCETELARLQAAGGEFERMRKKGWRIGSGPENHIQVIRAEQIPELVQQVKAHNYPVVVAINNAEVVRSFKSGCTTPLDAWTFGWLAAGIDQLPRPAPKNLWPSGRLGITH